MPDNVLPMLHRITVATFAVAAMISPGSAQSSAQAVDNLATPSGVATLPLGSLGHVEVLGRGPISAVLIPGAPFGWSVWKNFAARNAEKYTMYAITPAGYDHTPPPVFGPDSSIAARPWTLGLVRALGQLIDERKLDRPIIIANHHMAAYYALRLAVQRNCQVGGLVSLASTPVGFAPRTTRGGAQPTSLEDRRKILDAEWIPFYRAVDSVRWAAGVYAASALSTDSALGLRWHAEQLHVPRYTQARYYLEYLADDVSRDVAGLRVPILAIQPRARIRMTFSSDSARLAFMNRFGATSEAAAIDSVTRRNDQWLRLVPKTLPVEVVFLTTDTQLIMEDDAAAVDRLIWDFAQRRRGCGGPASR